MQDHWADYLESQEWDFFGTFTTGYSMTLPAARRAMERLRDIYKRETTFGPMSTEVGMRIFWVAEPFDTKEGYHTHALIYSHNRCLKDSLNEDGLSEDFARLKRSWDIAAGSKVGSRCDIQRYVPARGANSYLGKYLMKSHCDYEIWK